MMASYKTGCGGCGWHAGEGVRWPVDIAIECESNAHLKKRVVQALHHKLAREGIDDDHIYLCATLGFNNVARRQILDCEVALTSSLLR
jgi:hypothetical protein